MWVRVVVPLALVLILAVLVLVLVLYQRRKSQDIDRQERQLAERRWRGNCAFDNPKTGARCNREEFHLENHYHVLPDGSLTTWP